jgi:hypothetical protein
MDVVQVASVLNSPGFSSRYGVAHYSLQIEAHYKGMLVEFNTQS